MANRHITGYRIWRFFFICFSFREMFKNHDIQLIKLMGFPIFEIEVKEWEVDYSKLKLPQRPYRLFGDSRWGIPNIKLIGTETFGNHKCASFFSIFVWHSNGEVLNNIKTGRNQTLWLESCGLVQRLFSRWLLSKVSGFCMMPRRYTFQTLRLSDKFT